MKCFAFIPLMMVAISYSNATTQVGDYTVECFKLNGLPMIKDEAYFGLPSVKGCNPTFLGIANPAEIEPKGVQYCRELFRYYPCHLLRYDQIYERHAMKCTPDVIKYFEQDSRFDSGDLFSDKDALFFFIRKNNETYDNGFECLSVCKEGTIIHSGGHQLEAGFSTILSTFLSTILSTLLISLPVFKF